MNPVFHIYVLFFLGMSEISTSILCLVVCFDAEHGVGALGRKFPLTMKVNYLYFCQL